MDEWIWDMEDCCILCDFKKPMHDNWCHLAALVEAARITEEALRDLLSHVGNPNPDHTDKRTYVLPGHGKAWEDSVNRALDALASLTPAATEEK